MIDDEIKKLAKDILNMQESFRMRAEIVLRIHEKVHEQIQMKFMLAKKF